MSKRGIRCFSKIDLNVKLKLPRDLFGDLNEDVSNEVPIPGLGDLETGDTASTPVGGSRSVGSTWVVARAFDDSP